jgi:hypothetical protein
MAILNNLELSNNFKLRLNTICPAGTPATGGKEAEKTTRKETDFFSGIIFPHPNMAAIASSTFLNPLTYRIL